MVCCVGVLGERLRGSSEEGQVTVSVLYTGSCHGALSANSTPGCSVALQDIAPALAAALHKIPFPWVSRQSGRWTWKSVLMYG